MSKITYKVEFGFVMLPERGCAHCSCENNSAIEGVSICCICQNLKGKDGK